MLARRSTPLLRDRSDRPLLAAVGPVEVGTSVQLVIPVHNEVKVLERSVLRLRRHLDAGFPFPATITVADNASTDGTWEVASRLARTVPGVEAIRLADKGRGLALRAAWGGSPASVLTYMDVDLSTDLSALLPLISPVASGHSDVAIGTRLAPGARVRRGATREVISRTYNLLVRLAVGRRFSDAQCGFKAVSAEAAARLLPSVHDGGWFFDTELLLAATSAGMRIHEVPVDWVDDPDSRVRIISTAWNDIRGLVRVAHRTILMRLAATLMLVLAAGTAAALIAPAIGWWPAAGLAAAGFALAGRAASAALQVLRRSRPAARFRPAGAVGLTVVKGRVPVPLRPVR